MALPINGLDITADSIVCFFKQLNVYPLDVCRSEWTLNGPQEAGNSTPAMPHIGGLFSANPDVQSVWSFNQKETI